MSQKKWQICAVSRLHILCHSGRYVSLVLEDQNEHDEKKEEQDNNHGTDYKEGIDEEVDA